MAHPMLLIDSRDKPCRGYVSGEPIYLDQFFTQYTHFIQDYVQLLKCNIDAFIIGSEFYGITSVRDVNGSYPGI